MRLFRFFSFAVISSLVFSVPVNAATINYISSESTYSVVSKRSHPELDAPPAHTEYEHIVDVPLNDATDFTTTVSGGVVGSDGGQITGTVSGLNNTDRFSIAATAQNWGGYDDLYGCGGATCTHSSILERKVWFNLAETTTLTVSAEWSLLFRTESAGAGMWFRVHERSLTGGVGTTRLWESVSTPNDSGSGLEEYQLTLEAGDYYVWMGIQAVAYQYGIYGTSIIDSSISVSAAPSAVPVPAAVWLFGSALAGLGWMRRKHAA